MNMKMNLSNYLLLLGVGSLFFTSCVKNDVEEVGNRGATIVKLLESPENKIFFEPFTNIRDVSLFSLRKDAATSSDLNTPTPVKVKLNPTLIADYNTANGSDFEVLPDSLYTLDPTIVKTGSSYTMTFNAGDFAKDFGIKLNEAKWDLAHKYALGFTIEDAGGKTISAEKKNVVVLISIKNKWDGVYVAHGTMVDVTNAGLTGIYNDPGGYGVDLEFSLETVSATQCNVRDLNYTGGIFHPIWAGTGWSYYGSFCWVGTFAPACDKVINILKYYGQPAGNTRSAALDPSGLNQYDASTQTIFIKYFMKQPSSVPTPPNIRSYFDENWKFIRTR